MHGRVLTSIPGPTYQMTASPFPIAVLLFPSAALIENVSRHCQMFPLELKSLLVGDHCSESYHLEQLVISEIGNQLRLVIIACNPTVSNRYFLAFAILS